MIRLGNTTQKLQALLGGAVSATEADIVTSYRDEINTTQSQIRSGGASKLTNSSGASAVDIVAAPSQEQTIRVVEFISVRNNDTASITLTLRYNDNGTTYKIITAALASGDTLFYTPGTGFYITDSNGSIRTTRDAVAGSWTPVLTFATAGDLSVAYTAQVGVFEKNGNEVTASCSILTSTFTHTTASGNLRVTGLQHTSATVSGAVWSGSARWRGVTKANFTDVISQVGSAVAYFEFGISGSGQVATTIQAGDMPTGGTVQIIASAKYRAA